MSVHFPSSDPIRDALRSEPIESLAKKVKDKTLSPEAISSFLMQNLPSLQADPEGSAPLIEKALILLPVNDKELVSLITFLKKTNHFNQIENLKEMMFVCIKVNNFPMFSKLMEIYMEKIVKNKFPFMKSAPFFNKCSNLIEADSCDEDFEKLMTETEGALMKIDAKQSLSEQDAVAFLLGGTPLHEAILSHDLSKIEELIKNGADCTAEDALGFTPLGLAVSVEDETIVSLLINQVGLSGYNSVALPLLHVAVNTGNEKIVQLVLDAGADIHEKASNGKTALFCAVESLRGTKVVELLLQRGACIEEKNDRGLTPLLRAARLGNFDLVEFLLKKGASPKARDEDGNTALHHVILVQNEKIARLLVQHGADVNALNNNKYSPLCYFLIFSRKKLIPSLITFLEENGASLNVAQEILDRKKLAHIMGFEGESLIELTKGVMTRFPLEGLSNLISMEMVVDLFRRFIDFESTKKNWKNERHNFEQILSILERNVELVNDGDVETGQTLVDETWNRILRGEPVVVLGGTISHAINIIFVNDKIIVCNRGLGSKIDEEEMVKAGVVYSYSHGMVTREILIRLMKKHSDISGFQEVFVDLNLSPPTIGDLGFKMKRQKVGNCSWASSKTALFALLREYFGDEEARIIYKEFSLFARVRGFTDYAVNHRESNKKELVDHDLLKRAGEKVVGKLQARIPPGFLPLITTDLFMAIFESLPEPYKQSVFELLKDVEGPQLFKRIRQIQKSPEFGKYLSPQILSKKLFQAIRKNDIPMQVALIHLGVDPNLPDEDGHLLLNLFVDQGNIDIIEMLLYHGADPNAEDAQGMTPLQRAVSFGRLDIAQLLIKRGGNPLLKNQSGISALTVAKMYRNQSFIELFEGKKD